MAKKNIEISVNAKATKILNEFLKRNENCITIEKYLQNKCNSMVKDIVKFMWKKTVQNEKKVEDMETEVDAILK